MSGSVTNRTLKTAVIVIGNLRLELTVPSSPCLDQCAALPPIRMLEASNMQAAKLLAGLGKTL